MSALFTVASIYLACTLALIAVIDYVVGFVFRAPPASQAQSSSVAAKVVSRPVAAPQE